MNIVQGGEQVGSATETGQLVQRFGQQVGPAARRADELIGVSARQTAQGLRAAADALETRSWGRWVLGAIAVLLIIAAFYVLGGNNAPQFLTFIPREGIASALERSDGWWMGPVESGVVIPMTPYRYDRWELEGPVFTNSDGRKVTAVRQQNPENSNQIRWYLEGTAFYFLRDEKGTVYAASDPNAW